VEIAVRLKATFSDTAMHNTHTAAKESSDLIILAHKIQNAKNFSPENKLIWSSGLSLASASELLGVAVQVEIDGALGRAPPISI
jgi:hypothetical protein